MAVLQPGKLIRVLLNTDDKYHGKPLYEALVDRCRELGVAGATVFQGLEGFGESAEIVHPKVFGRAEPVTVTIIESPENAAALLPELNKIAPHCLVAISDVQMIRIQNGQPR